MTTYFAVSGPEFYQDKQKKTQFLKEHLKILDNFYEISININ